MTRGRSVPRLGESTDVTEKAPFSAKCHQCRAPYGAAHDLLARQLSVRSSLYQSCPIATMQDRPLA